MTFNYSLYGIRRNFTLRKRLSFLRCCGASFEECNVKRPTFVRNFRCTCSEAQVTMCSTRLTAINGVTFLDTIQRGFCSKSSAKADKLMPNEVPELEDCGDSGIAKAVPHDVLISILQNCSNVEDQMRTLCSTLSLTPEDINKRMGICDSIKDMLQPFFEDLDVSLFGSSVNSFGFKGCDIDMVFKTGPNKKDVMKSSFDDSDIPSIEDVLSGNTSPAYMSKLSGKDQLLFIHTVFLDYYRESVVAPIFIKAYVPLIRFNHDKYELKCDFTCRNSPAMSNTKLLYLMGKLDDRITPLIMTLRYWGKQAGLIGGGLMFNTYSLTLLVIYFLQTRTPPVLPSVDFITSHTEAILSDVNVVLDETLMNEVSKIPPSKNTQTVEELLREFFFYYLYFDFNQVICPATASTVPREAFSSEEYNKRFRLNTICVQDPIKLQHNVSNLVDYKHCKLFAREMFYASTLFQDRSVWRRRSGAWGLAALLSRPTDFFDNLASLTCKFEVQVVPVTQKDGKRTFGDLQFVQTAESLMKVLKHGLLIDCQPIWSVDMLTDDSQIPELENNQLLVTLHCKGKHNTWLGRNNVKLENLSPSMVKNILDLEHAISLKLHKKEEGEKKQHFEFLCKCYVSKSDSSLVVKLSSIDNSNVHPILGVFLKEYLPNIVKKL